MEDSKRMELLQCWVRECEADFSARLDAIADALCQRENLKVIRLAGPTCSGKTTLANLLRTRFAKKGKHLHLISIDDFYYDKEYLHARMGNDGSGKVDYDSIHTIDLHTLRNFVRDIFTKESAECPIFDFIEGKRTGVRCIESRAEDVFVFEGIQALYPEILELIASYGPSIGVYIAPQSPLIHGAQCFEPNEIRLLRRLVRDYRFRGTPPARTLFLWESVRHNEEINIFPYVHECEVSIDSTMPYEIGILKPFLCEILPDVDPLSPHKALADQILAQLGEIEPLDACLIEEGSLYKEFI